MVAKHRSIFRQSEFWHLNFGGFGACLALRQVEKRQKGEWWIFYGFAREFVPFLHRFLRFGEFVRSRSIRR